MSNKTLQKIDIFLSSPSDVSDERQAAIRVIERLNRMQHIATKYVLKPLAYENAVPAAIGEKPQTTVNKYMMEAGQSDLFICILWHRMGTPVIHEETGEHFLSGTEYEFVDAYRANQRTGKPYILLYRGMKPIPPDSDFEQMVNVQTFFKRFEGDSAEFKGLYKSYKTVEEFEEILFHDLDRILDKNLMGLVDHAMSEPLAPTELRADFYQHTLLPPNYVPRPELLAELRDTVISQQLASESASVGSLLALHGMGGIGKSVMARALCDDKQIQAAFPDGILWATLGQSPNVAARLREWITALGGTISENAPSDDSLKAQLARLLESRKCLLIVDDVWRKKDADTFRVGGPDCQQLITTRDAEVARQLGARIQPIPIMTLNEASQLLEEWADDRLADSDPALATRIAERLGRLPLALKLAGAQLQRKTPEEWLRTFDARKLKSKRAEDVHDSLEQTFGLSLDALQTSERHLYAALAVFRKDEAIPEIAISRLWQVLGHFDTEAATDLVDDLAARALLEVARTSYPGAVVLHDLLRDFMSAELGEAEIQVHRSLLDAYRATRKGASWHTAIDDGYLYDHLVYHLQQAGATDDIRALFADQNWMGVRVPQHRYEYDGYLADLMTAWEAAHAQAHQQSEAGEPPIALAECIRYALIHTSINSIAGNQVPMVVAYAVECGLWQPGRALSIAIKVPDAQERVSFLAALLNTHRLTEEQDIETQQTGLTSVVSIKDPWRRALALAALVPHLTGSAFRRGLDVADSIEDKPGLVKALAAFALQLAGEPKDELLNRAVETALSLDKRRSIALATLAPQLAGNLQLRAFESALALENSKECALALVALAPYLEPDLLPRALDAAMSIQERKERGDVLAALLPRLSGSAQGQALLDALETTNGLESPKERAVGLAALLPMLVGKQKDEVMQAALDAALSFEGKWGRAEALAALAPHLTETMLTRVLDAAIALSNESVFGGSPYAQVIAALALRLKGHGGRMARALEAAGAIEGDVGRAEALVALIPYLDGDLKQQTIQMALETALQVRKSTGRSQVLATLAPHLDNQQLDYVLNSALTIADEAHQVKAIAALAGSLSASSKPRWVGEALAIAVAIDGDDARSEGLAILAPHLTDELVERAFESAVKIGRSGARAEALSALSSKIPDELVQRAVEAAMKIDDPVERVEILSATVSRLDGNAQLQLLRDAMDSLPSLDWQRAAMLVRLAPFLTGDLLKRALDDAFAMQDDWRRTDVLVALEPYVTGDLLQKIIESALGIDDDVVRVRTLVAILPKLSDSQRTEIAERGLEAALKLPEESLFGGLSRGEALAAMAPALSEERLRSALRNAFSIGKDIERAKAIAAFLPQIGAIHDAPDQATLLTSIHRAIVTYLLTLKDKRRADALDFCSEHQLFGIPICAPETVEIIIQSIVEICQRWQWL